MSKLRDILIERMVGDMAQIYTLKNAKKTPEELNELVKPKIGLAEVQIKSLMLEIYGEALKAKSIPEMSDIFRKEVGKL